jgi:hypothetical protein
MHPGPLVRLPTLHRSIRQNSVHEEYRSDADGEAIKKVIVAMIGKNNLNIFAPISVNV